MPADDLPYDALENLFKLEDSSTSGVRRFFIKWLSRGPLPPPLDRLFKLIKELTGEDSAHRFQTMVETLQNELRRVTGLVESLYARMSVSEQQVRARTFFELVLDGARKSEQTRSEERIKHIGIILANAVIDTVPIDADYIEEMMRVAMNIGDQDLIYLRELVRIMGSQVERSGRVDRYNAFTIWEQGSWGARIDPEIDSAFSKLESFGLVSRIPPPNNLNIMADFQNRYVLLKKGLRFVQMLASRADQN